MIEYTDTDQFDGADGRAPTENLAPGPEAQPDAAEAPEPVDEFAGPTTTEEQSDAGTSAPETTDPEPSPTPASAPKPTSGAKKSKEKKTMPTLATKPAPKPAPTPKPAKAPTPAPKAPKPAKAPTPVKAPPAPPQGPVGVNGNGKAAPVKDKGTPVKAKLEIKAPAAGKPKAAKAPGKPKPGDKVSIIDAAATVLKGRKTPMSCKDLMEEIVKRGLRKAPTTKYPGSNLGFILITDIENKGMESRFVKTAPGRFAYNHK
jgi:hypothetical protein